MLVGGSPRLSRRFRDRHLRSPLGNQREQETYAGNGYDGVRLEDEVVVTGTGIEIITKFPTNELFGCGMNY